MINNWKEAVMSADIDIKSAIDYLFNQKLGIVLVVDDNGVLLGTITDSDIRQFLNRKKIKDVTLNKVMNPNPRTAFKNEDRQLMKARLGNLDLAHIPIIDNNGVLLGLETISSLEEYNSLQNPVLIMAGGFGKRLLPLTKNIPKPLVTIGNKPMIQGLIEKFVAEGFLNFFVSTHYKAEMLLNFLGDGSRWGVHINHLHEKRPMGTAGAIASLPLDGRDIPTIVINADIITKLNFVNLINYHNEKKFDITICVREHSYQIPFGVVRLDGDYVKKIDEKPVTSQMVNIGIYILNRSVINMVNKGEVLSMPQLINRCVDAGYRVGCFPVHEYWADVGRIDQLNQVRDNLND